LAAALLPEVPLFFGKEKTRYQAVQEIWKKGGACESNDAGVMW
jgi:hypothetical protein